MENNNIQKVTDLSYLVSLSKGDNGFVKKMVTVFLEENPKEVSDLEKSILKKDYDAIKSSAHKLKSTIPFVGLDAIIGKEVTEIESLAGKSSGIEIIGKLYDRIKKNFDLAGNELQVYLNQ